MCLCLLLISLAYSSILALREFDECVYNLMKYFCVPLFQGFINVHSYMCARMMLQPCQQSLREDLAPLPAC